MAVVAPSAEWPRSAPARFWVSAALAKLAYSVSLRMMVLCAVARARKIERFLSQPFHVAEIFTGKPGKFVSLEQTIAGFKALLGGAYDHLPEQAFYMVGPMEEVIEKARELAPTSGNKSLAVVIPERHRMGGAGSGGGWAFCCVLDREHVAFSNAAFAWETQAEAMAKEVE